MWSLSAVSGPGRRAASTVPDFIITFGSISTSSSSSCSAGGIIIGCDSSISISVYLSISPLVFFQEFSLVVYLQSVIMEHKRTHTQADTHTSITNTYISTTSDNKDHPLRLSFC